MGNQEKISKMGLRVAIYGSLVSEITIHGSLMSEFRKGMEVHVSRRYQNVHEESQRVQRFPSRSCESE